MLGITAGQQQKSTEKLSSGYKINRAADDAAGLSISEKMRRQIRGLDRASTNAQDGISSVQTAEGALNEVHDMLQRMNELANQAANGTNSASDRQSIQDEISQLNTEIDRVAETTKFNETYLLKGDAGTKTITLKGHDAGLKGTLSDQGATATFSIDLKTDSDISITSHNYHIYDEDSDKIETVQDKVDTSDKVVINGTTYTKTETKGSDHTASAATLSVSAAKLTCKAAQKQVSVAGLQACVAGKQACAAKLTSKANGVASTYNLYKASADNKTKQADDLEAAGGNASSVAALRVCAAKLTCTAAKKQVSVAVQQACVAGKQACVAKMTSKANGVSASYDTLKASADNKTASAKRLEELSSDDSAIFKADGKEYSTNEVKALIVDGAKVGLNDEKARTAVDTINNTNNKTLKEVKNLIKDALLQANQIGADDETAVAVSNASKNNDTYSYTITKGTVEVAKEKSFELHVGADADLTNKITVNIETMNSKYLGVQDLNVVDDSGVKATMAIDAIEDALSKVSAQRSSLGAVQNRLEHTISNLDNVVENTQSAESEIRDTDMADEMVRYSKNNILTQAGQSMLAQANQSTQGVLSLLG
jgi:flagellin-like hook-associated protein FlgL